MKPEGQNMDSENNKISAYRNICVCIYVYLLNCQRLKAYRVQTKKEILQCSGLEKMGGDGGI